VPNPNYSELRLNAKYGEDASTRTDAQNANLFFAISEDSDEIDHKYVYEASLGGLYIELAHYTSVKQVVLQNFSSFPGATFYIDNTTGALVPGWVPAGQHVSFNDPDVTAGIILYSIAAAELTDWHIAICGRKD